MDLTKYIEGALYGACIGDTHAFPLHWYYSYDIMRKHVRQYYRTSHEDYMTDFHGNHPFVQHPDSFKYFSKYDPKQAEQEVFKDKFRIIHFPQELWKKEGQPYHLTLRQGENTVTVQLAMILMEELTKSLQNHEKSKFFEASLYPRDDYLRRYFDFFTKENQHHDFYIEEIHREFFANYAKGKPLAECGKEDETCLSGLTLMLPLVFVFGQNVIRAKTPEEHSKALHLLKEIVSQHSILTHRSAQMAELVCHIAELLVNIMGIPEEDDFIKRKEKALVFIQDAFDKINLGDPITLADITGLSEEDVFIGKNCARKFSVR